ncbi:MAG: hypothetical protein OEV99_14700 [Nitrospira sp.]|nr:hypothetical protein [Nitrospira sp.]MDH4371072.1 hypothetical protein [Nitrospira sp.]MDH5498012.1 hypothetical protein [Nitrospira sp.]MDH5726533.1 hypothetical protein [Nitrospira sp.]
MKLVLLLMLLGSLLAAASPSLAETKTNDASDILLELQHEVLAGAENVGQSTKAVPAEDTVDYARYRMQASTNDLILALSVMTAGLLSLFLLLWNLRTIAASSETMVNGSGLVLVIFATVLVMILAKADQQLTAATGILGAIAGYLFGKTTKNPDGERKSDTASTS